jgi:hypothetical protein
MEKKEEREKGEQREDEEIFVI